MKADSVVTLDALDWLETVKDVYSDDPKICAGMDVAIAEITKLREDNEILKAGNKLVNQIATRALKEPIP